MNIQTSPSITFSDLMATPGTVLVLPEIEILHDRTSAGILAGVCLPDGDGKGMPRIITIEHHCGRKAWCVRTEHTIQKATEHEFNTLPAVVHAFEDRVGVQLPPIKVIHFGVGIYAAHSLYTSDNPWQLKDGEFYTVRDPRRGQRTFVADVRNGRTLISFVDDPMASDTFEPSVVLSAHEWRSLAPATDPTTPQTTLRPKC